MERITTNRAIPAGAAVATKPNMNAFSKMMIVAVRIHHFDDLRVQATWLSRSAITPMPSSKVLTVVAGAIATISDRRERFN